ncbi:hypothetical protein PN498_09075 [Oscillatoria sp. CS-180]|uniref:hypothetical protein n=1 Tax=Oscillatoria sp. CS-180 TaxID=3021720 RepID=UPI00232FBFBB|nr:hypothetical protein [Oscillatoria sp. CS-180]MDB9526136.1 hypothetical protein [Oscillatoria sp. CS-180]
MKLSALPGAELVLPGLKDLQNGKTDTVEALLVAIASTRLTQAGLDVPSCLVAEPELALYGQLEDIRDDAYPHYNALLSSLNSFCNALEITSYQEQLQ